ncbi:MAG: hypothetical protein HFI16_12000 [Lachnospiraceae bacterium]|nr:hypothetical protein [Lachnospiraceae bacterium]
MAEKIEVAFIETAKKYLEILREREPQLWKEPLKESGFTEKDLSDIEKGTCADGDGRVLSGGIDCRGQCPEAIFETRRQDYGQDNFYRGAKL